MEKFEKPLNLKWCLAFVLATSFLFNALVVCFVAYGWVQIKTDYGHLEGEIERIKTKLTDCTTNQELGDNLKALLNTENEELMKRLKREVVSSGKVDLDYQLRGAPGPIGPPGTPGKDGKDGRDGRDFTSLSVLKDVIDERVTSESFDSLDKQMWLEVFLTADQSWITISSEGEIISDLKLIEENICKPITYIMSYDNASKVKDITQKYDSHWMTGTKKIRVGDKWWEEMITPHHVKESKKNKQEDEKIKTQQEQMPFPNTIGGFKDHPLYALERHLLKFQGIYPTTAVSLGYTKTKEPIYSRSCVHTLHSRETWLKEALQIKIGEEPYKMVKPRPKMSDIKNGIKITEATLPVYGDWQTEPYDPPQAEDGKVPRNGYGNVELFKPQMLPIGCVHIQNSSIGRLARKMNIDCAQAMIGWDSHSGASIPMFDGWVVCEEYEETLMDALEEYEAEQAQRERDKLEKRIYGNWKKLIKGLLIRERLRSRYGGDNF